MEKIRSLYISNLNFNNSQFIYDSYDALTMRYIANLSILDSYLNNVTQGAAINVQNSPDDVSLAELNFSNISINSSGSLESGGLNITGNFLVTLTSAKFSFNRGTPGSAFNFYSFSDQANFIIKNCQFQFNDTGYLIIPNNSFYENFIKYDAKYATNLIFMSFAHKVKVYLLVNQSLQIINNENDIIKVYSGEQIDFIFETHDHFDQVSDSFDFGIVELKSKNNESNLMNQKAIFSKSNASFLSFAMVVPFQQITNKTIELQAIFTNDNQNTLVDYNFSLLFQIKPCDIGHIINNDICVVCDHYSYSFDENPTNTSQCQPCPENAICENGNSIKPYAGFWNLNDKNAEIIECETQESCNIGCGEGYFGYVCHECQENYGKSLIRQCTKCNDAYIQTHILRSVCKWIILALISYIQYKILTKFKTSENNQTILSLINIFIFHSNILAMSFRFQNDFPNSYENFLETQSVFSFLENNLYLVYCIFPYFRDFQFYIVIFIYFLLGSLFQIFIIMIYLLSKKLYTFIFSKDFEILTKWDIVEIVSLVFLNNFITIFYYFIGLVLFFDVDQKVSVDFMELSLSSGQFYLILFVIFLIVFWIYIGPILVFFKLHKTHLLDIILDCPYKDEYKYLTIINYICLFFTVLLSHYAFVGNAFSGFIKNMFMIQLGFFVTFKIFKSDFLPFFKIISQITLIVSFFQYYQATIVLNCCFYFSLIVYGLAKVSLRESMTSSKNIN